MIGTLRGSSRLFKTIGKVQDFIAELETGHEEAKTAKEQNNQAVEAARQKFEAVQVKKTTENAVIDNHIASGQKLLALLKSAI